VLLQDSTLSQIETLTIISTWGAMTQKIYNCALCLTHNKPEHREKKKFCNTPSKRVLTEYKGFFNYYRCPGSFASSWAVELISMHGLFESGQLPYEGGILDQPAKYIEVMRLIGSLKLEHQKDLEAKAKKWQTTKSVSNSRSSKPRR
jgi:hypothetical protein